MMISFIDNFQFVKDLRKNKAGFKIGEEIIYKNNKYEWFEIGIGQRED